MPSATAVSAPKRTPLVRPNLWLLLVGAGFGLTTWAAFLYIGIRAQRRAWLAWAAVYGALLMFFFLVLVVLPPNSALLGIDVVGWLIAWPGGTVHAAMIKGKAAGRLRPPGADRTWLEQARQRMDRRAEGRRLAGKDPLLAREAGVGRPDLPGADDFGLIDFNHVPREVLCRLPGITPEVGRRIVESREGAGSFQSVEDLGIAANLPPSLVDSIREYAIFL